ncbi:diguanylate cyclase [Escherichia coli]|uniref:GGDEF domain-containing protein n=1 Tax=Escherichia coli TaxID=562 RepID=UPI0016925B66|nr:diguanylate cyclase [Escherichia coli]HAH1064475.1 diguanylate cyclase [Escherichia coli]
MSRINKFVLTVSLLIFIMISAVACGIYTQMVKERVYSLKQSVIDTAFAVANIAEYRRSVAIDLINTLNPTEEQLLVGLRTAYADSVSPSYLYDVGPYLISSDECIQVKEFEKNYCADIMQVVKYRHVKNTGFISFDGKTFVYYLYPVTHNRSLIFLLGLERFSLLSKSLAMEHFAYLPTGLYVFAYKKDVYLRVCTLIIFFAALVAVISGTSCLYLVRRVINRGIVEKEAIINNHFERVLDGGLFFSAADVKKLYSMYNSAFLDDLTKAMGRKSFDEDLKALPEKGGYLCLFDVDKFKNINDTFGHLLGDEVLMKVVKILKSQIPVDKGKIYRFGGDEFAVIYTGGTLEELLSILKEIVHFQVGSINLSTSIGVAHSNECTTVERLKMLADERLYKSKKNGRAQISWQ